MAGGSLPGPARPYQVVASKPAKPCSCIVGTFGWPLARLVRVCATASTRPFFTCGVAAVMVSKLYWICPPIRSASSGPLPLYGTCSASTPPCSLNISSARCWAEPAPAEPKLTVPGAALQAATMSFTLRAFWPGLAMSRLGVTPTSTIGTKSRSTL
ncbi:hypothetical protein D3C87_967750 [compost metagenome]